VFIASNGSLATAPSGGAERAPGVVGDLGPAGGVGSVDQVVDVGALDLHAPSSNTRSSSYMPVTIIAERGGDPSGVACGRDHRLEQPRADLCAVAAVRPTQCTTGWVSMCMLIAARCGLYGP
jgi:hypothetical protein